MDCLPDDLIHDPKVKLGAEEMNMTLPNTQAKPGRPTGGENHDNQKRSTSHGRSVPFLGWENNTLPEGRAYGTVDI
jgi:hypothetical protein